MKLIELQHPLSYPICINRGLMNTPLLINLVKKERREVVFFVDNNLPKKWVEELSALFMNQAIEHRVFFIEVSESTKTRKTREFLENLLLENGYGRDTFLVAIGGGVTTDVVGFVASTYCRGIPFLALPTTLLGMVDASLGGKTGVNTRHGKNLIGSFYQPQGVFIDLEVLNSLPEKEWGNGIVEMIKHALIASPSLFGQLQVSGRKIYSDLELLSDLIYQSLLIKKEIVEQDPQEEGKREWLNAGHTIGHAIEQIEEYQLSHGEAVAIGLILELKLSVELGYLEHGVVEKVISLLKEFHLPLKTKAFENKTLFLNQLERDKKSKKRIPSFVLFNNIGSPLYSDHSYTFPIKEELLEKVLDWGREIF